ncbi:hypothetical protein MUCCIDRAFT_107519 [Mucor lusitanicus CBS 277.49]|uniref:Uncharacterized protein n=1 Tax=Mucor lusitanicus CBS 277.49 TaxID=747725 RepID=A0A162TT27_MUCCL|nr:hypothetical protein MUCCIDRAFT_107519 [Mucor lusitanicus CBS 277.49]
MQNNRWLPTGASSSRASSIHEDQQQFFASKEECHLKTSKTLDDWEYVDSLSKNTRNSIEKTSKTLDRLLDKKLSILAAVKDFNDIQSSLDVGAIARKHWISQEDEEG